MRRKYKQKQTKFILGTVYIHPNMPQKTIEYFMFHTLGAYFEAIRQIFPNMNPDTKTPILLCGDFNMDITQNKSFVNFMKSKFNLDCISSASTTLAIRA
jgi:endonuclease/exonuclease/phosphatase family metal-dependent hydrolase